jgi:hypothetical protein
MLSELFIVFSFWLRLVNPFSGQQSTRNQRQPTQLPLYPSFPGAPHEKNVTPGVAAGCFGGLRRAPYPAGPAGF